MEISNSDINFYEKNGYLHLINPFNLDNLQIKSIQEDANQMINYAKKGKHRMVRVYDDYPHYINGINVAAIEDPIVLMPNKLKLFLSNLSIPDIMSRVVQLHKFNISLIRIHTTNFFKFQGSWHQDSRNNVDKSILANFYFFEESGFKFLLRDHPLNAIKDENKVNQLKTIDDYKDIKFSPGDLCFFDPFIFHKAYSSKKRFHLHIRIDSYDNESINIIKKFEDYRLTDKTFYVKDRGSVVNNIKASVKRHINLFKYLIPSRINSNIFL